MMQESDGCVRVGSTANGLNPGLMQSNNGMGNCFNVSPCPIHEIELMLMDGAGQGREFGLKQAMEQMKGIPEPIKFYRAARAYNAGPYGVTAEHLEQGGATRCYSSDIANRLLGWTDRADSACPFDDPSYLTTATTSVQETSVPFKSNNNSAPSSVDIPSTRCNCEHVVEEGDTCYSIAQAHSTTFEKMRELNPSLNSGCTNLWLGYRYCVSK